MKKIFAILLVFTVAVSLTACGQNTGFKVDYENSEVFEEALNKGEQLEGKTVTFMVSEVVPDSAFGYNLQAGEHLNFCSANNPGVKAGDTVTVKITEVTSMLGSYILNYEKIK